MTKKQLEASVESLGDIHRVEAPWDKALEILKSRGISYPISARDLAYARMNERRDRFLSNFGSYIMEGVLYKPLLFVRNSPLLTRKAAIQVTNDHRSGIESYFDSKIYQEQAEEDKGKVPEERRVLTLTQREDFEISTDGFVDEELTLWLFKDQAQVYGDFLKSEGINKLPVWLVDSNYVVKQGQSFVRQLWLDNLGFSRSGLVCNYLNMDHSRVRGMLKKTGEASFVSEKAQYTQKELEEVSHVLTYVKKGILPVAKLEKALKLMKKLRGKS